MTNIHKGSSLESFLETENLLIEAEAIAIKRVIAYELKKAMQEKHLTKTALAHQLQTSRSSLERLLDPENTSITLQTLLKTAAILGKKIRFSLI
jgi:DNA-binding Xre family transcriptional regulator